MRHVTHDIQETDTGDVVLDDAPGRMWTYSRVSCMQCGEEWIGTHPVACGRLKCPECGSADTIRSRVQDDGHA